MTLRFDALLANQVAQRIVAARTARHLTQDALAERLETATRNLQRIESGRQNLTLGTIERIAHALGEEPAALLPGRTSRFVPRGEFAATPRVVPVVALARVATLVRDPQGVELEGWWIVDRPADGFFFGARIDDDAMEPLVPAGSYSLFRAPADEGSRSAIFLWQRRSPGEAEDGGTFFVRRRLAEERLVGGVVRVTLGALKRREVSETYILDDTLRPVARFVCALH